MKSNVYVNNMSLIYIFSAITFVLSWITFVSADKNCLLRKDDWALVWRCATWAGGIKDGLCLACKQHPTAVLLVIIIFPICLIIVLIIVCYCWYKIKYNDRQRKLAAGLKNNETTPLILN